jgi:hypothetical protein
MTEEARRERNLESAWFLQEVVRLLKLYFFCVIEHIRSSEGGQAWEDTNKMVNTFATHEEEVEFLMEFGRAQPGRGKRQVYVYSICILCGHILCLIACVSQPRLTWSLGAYNKGANTRQNLVNISKM